MFSRKGFSSQKRVSLKVTWHYTRMVSKLAVDSPTRVRDCVPSRVEYFHVKRNMHPAVRLKPKDCVSANQGRLEKGLSA